MQNILFAAITAMMFGSSFARYQLIVEIRDIRNDNGMIMFRLFDEKEKIIYQQITPVKDRKCNVIINDLTEGRYAIRYYHDENMNGKMETNAFGKPVEGYGFSNNIVARFGPPDFEKMLFEIREDKKIVLKPVY